MAKHSRSCGTQSHLFQCSPSQRCCFGQEIPDHNFFSISGGSKSHGLLVRFACRLSSWKFPQWTDTESKQFWLGTAIFPSSARQNIEMTMLLWSFMYTLCVFVSACKSTKIFKFIALLVVDTQASIKPNDLRLNQIDFAKFRKYRNWALLMLRVVICWITYCGFVGLLLLCYLGERFAVSLFGCIFWTVVLTFWTACVSSGMLIVLLPLDLRQFVFNSCLRHSRSHIDYRLLPRTQAEDNHWTAGEGD